MMVYRLRILSLLILCLFSIQLLADTITIHNETDQKIFVALYKQKSVIKKSEAKRASGPFSIDPHQTANLDRPSRELGYDRELAFSYQENNLSDTKSVSDFNMMTHANAGD